MTEVLTRENGNIKQNYVSNKVRGIWVTWFSGRFPAHDGFGTGWSLIFLLTQIILWFYEYFGELISQGFS